MSSLLKKLTQGTCLSAVLVGLQTSFANADVYVFALTNLSPDSVQNVKINVGKLLKEKTVRGDIVVLYDRSLNQLISHATIADASHSRHYASRINQTKPMIGDFVRYVAEQAKQQTNLEIRAPSIPTQFFREFSDSIRTLYPNKQISVLLNGSPLQNDPREPSTSMRDGAYPNDESIVVDSFTGSWGTKDRKHTHNNITYHFCYEDGYFLNSSHEEIVHRLWSLYLGEQGGSLSSFTADKDICFSRFLSNSKPNRKFKLKAENKKAKMLSVKREQRKTVMIEEVNPPTTPLPALTGTGDTFLRSDVEINTQPARRTYGKIQIGTTWGAGCISCDLDLHVRPAAGADILSYDKTSSSYGKFNKDWTNSPSASNAHEFINIEKPVNALGMEIWVNFYSGSHPTGPKGTIRIWIEGYKNVFEQEFHIPSKRGQASSQPRNTANWIKLNPASILGLAREGG